MPEIQGEHDCAMPFMKGHTNFCTCGGTRSHTTTIEISPLNDHVLNETWTADLISNPSVHSYIGPSNKKIANSGRMRNRTTSSSSDNAVDKKKISHCVFLIPFTLTVISLLLAIFSTVMFLRLSSKYDQLEEKMSFTEAAVQQEPTLCLPCKKITQGPFGQVEQNNLTIGQFEQKQENGELVCCAKGIEQTSALLNLFAKRKQVQKCVEDFLKENKTGEQCVTASADGTGKISAYLQAGIQTSFASGDLTAEEEIKNWHHDRPGTHLLGIELTNDRFVIPKTGHYFVYSQVGFLINYEHGNESVDDKTHSIFHKVKRYNKIYPLEEEELLRSTITQCWDKTKKYGRYTSYVGAAVLLTKEDQIFVKASRVTDLSRDRTHTYFGLFFMF